MAIFRTWQDDMGKRPKSVEQIATQEGIELTDSERLRLQEPTSADPITDYNGHPNVQLDMILDDRNGGAPEEDGKSNVSASTELSEWAV